MENPETQSVYTSQAEIDEEDKKIRRLQIMMSMVMSVLYQDPNLTLEEASCLLYTSPSPRDRSLSRMPSSA